jgi:large subunit ribosomal protein L17
MRHRKRGRQLSRPTAHRSAMLRNMVTSLLDHERIETTDAKAKEVRRVADRMITLGKRGTLDARRRALRVIRARDVAAKVFDDLTTRFADRPGGYTRVIKTNMRIGDAASMSIVELVEGPAKPEAKAAPTKRTAKQAAPKKVAARKPAAKDTAPKKRSAEKETAPKKGATRKASAKKGTAKKAASKKAAASKKGTTKKAAAKKSASKKSAAKKK